MICERLTDGETLTAICKDEAMPAERTVRRWALDNVQGFSPQYARAREIGYHAMADEIIDIADDTSSDTVKDENGNERANHEWITRSRFRVDTRKWLLSKALPKIYGDKVTAEVTGKDGAALEAAPSHLEIARRVAFLLMQGMQEAEERATFPAGIH
jgi:hypothetical protein